jgi:cytochrome P450
VLVVDGAKHDDLRRRMQPALHKKMIAIYTAAMLRATDQVLDSWESGAALDMLVEMRKIALLIIMQTLYREDFTPELVRLWDAVLKTIQYISPGLWMFWRGAPRPGLTDGLRRMDAYLHRVIDHRRSNLGVPDDLLGLLIEAGMDSELIRDQLLTMFIAGHDTSTALLAWSLVLLGKHPSVLAQVKAEVDAVLQGAAPTPEHRLPLLDAVIDEALRLYPPIHLSSRTAAVDLEFQGYHIPQGARVLFSIYLTQRHPDYWSDAAAFKPERFLNSPAPEPYTYLPFGGGKRNCIGALFAQIETRLVLARIFQRFDLSLIHDHIHAHMGATLEPRPGVLMRVQQR